MNDDDLLRGDWFARPDASGLPAWDEVAPQFTSQFPGLDAAEMQRRYEHERMRRNEIRWIDERDSLRPTGTGATIQNFALTALPFSSVARAANSAVYGRARRRIDEGNPEPGDFAVVYDHESQEAMRQQQTLGESVLESGAHALSAVQEMGLTGPVLGMAMPSLMSQAPLLSRGAIASGRAFAGATARTGAMTLAMPTMWLPQWTESNIANGRDGFDLRGLPSSFAMGYLNTAVLGSLGGVGDRITTAGIRGAAARWLTRVGTGVLEQQAIDAGASAISEILPEAYRLQTGYGLLGQAISSGRSGNFDPLYRNALGQLVTFSVFSALHERQSPREAVEEIRQNLQTLRESGLTQREQGEAIANYLDGAVEATQAIGQQQPLAIRHDLTPEANVERQMAMMRRLDARRRGENRSGEPLPDQPFQPLTPEPLQPTLMPPSQESQMPGFMRQGQPSVQEARTPSQTSTGVVLSTEAPQDAPAGQPWRPVEVVKRTYEQDLVKTARAMGVNLGKSPDWAKVERILLDDGQHRVVQELRNLHPEAPELPAEQAVLSSTNPKLQKLLERAEDEIRRNVPGTVTMEEFSQAAGFRGREGDIFFEHVINRRTLEDIAQNDYKGITKQAITGSVAKPGPWLRAAKKAGLDPTQIDEYLKRVDLLNKQAMKIADGNKAVELVADPEQRVVIENHERGLAEIQDKIQALANSYTKEAGREKPSAQRLKEIERKIAALERKYRAGYSKAEATPESRAGRIRNADDANLAGELIGESVRSPESQRVIEEGSNALRELWADDVGAVPDPASYMMEKGREYYDGLRRLAGHMFPSIQRAGGASADKAAEFVSSQQYMDRVIPFLQEKVIGQVSPERAQQFGAALNELRFRYASYAKMQKAKELIAESYQPGVSAEEGLAMRKRAFELQVESQQVGTFIGGDELPTEAAYQQIIRSKEMGDVARQWQRYVSPILDAYYRKAQGIPEQDAIDSLTQIPGFTFSVVMGKPEGENTIRVAKGNLRNPKARRMGAANKFMGTGEGYEVNLNKILEQSFRLRIPTANKAELYRTMVDEGLAVWGREHPGEGYTKFEDVKPPWGTQANQRGQDHLYVKSEYANEFRQLLQADKPLPKLPGADFLTKVTLASLVEMTGHGSNLAKSIFLPNSGPWTLLKNAYKVWTKEPAMMEKLVELARTGMDKPAGNESPEASAVSTMLAPGQRVLEIVNGAARVMLSDAHDMMVKKGLADPAGKRDFINTNLGQYNGAAQHWIIAKAREIGVSPFATAGITFNLQGIRAAFAPLFGPGVKATSTQAAIKLRAIYTAKLLTVLAAVPALNALLWGRWDGDEHTPLGAVKLGTNDLGKTAYLDLASATGVSRGLRVTGLLAGLEGSRYGASGGDIGNRAAADMVSGFAHAFQGPPLNFAYIALTGETPSGHTVMDAPDRGELEVGRRIAAAALNANPVIAQLRGVQIPGTDTHVIGTRHEREMTGTERAVGLFGTVPGVGRVGFRDRPPGQPFRPYLARGPEVDQLNDIVANMRRARTEAERRGEQYADNGTLRSLQRVVDRINRLENSILGGRQQRRLAPDMREPRDLELERDLRARQKEMAEDALDGLEARMALRRTQ